MADFDDASRAAPLRSHRPSLALAFGAQIYNQGVTVAVQLALVAILLYAWGPERYGVWLFLSAIPSYLTLSDLGLTFIAKNELVIRHAAGDRTAVLRTYQSVNALLLLILPPIFLAALAATGLVDFRAILSLDEAGARDARWTIVILVASVLLYQHFLLLCGGLRCANSAAEETAWGATARLAEAAAISLVALAGGGIVAAATAVLANRCLFVIGAHQRLRRSAPWLRLAVAHAHRPEMRRLLAPSFAYMLVPISQALLVQTPTVVLGILQGPLAVVVFTATRILVRLGTSASQMINFTAQPYYSLLFGRGEHQRFRVAVRTHIVLTFLAIIAYAAVLYAAGDALMRILTHGKVEIVQPFFAVMGIAVACEMLWSAFFAPLSATNQHSRFAVLSAVACTAAAALLYPLIHKFGLTGAASALLAANFALIFLAGAQLALSARAMFAAAAKRGATA